MDLKHLAGTAWRSDRFVCCLMRDATYLGLCWISFNTIRSKTASTSPRIMDPPLSFQDQQVVSPHQPPFCFLPIFNFSSSRLWHASFRHPSDKNLIQPVSSPPTLSAVFPAPHAPQFPFHRSFNDGSGPGRYIVFIYGSLRRLLLHPSVMRLSLLQHTASRQSPPNPGPPMRFPRRRWRAWIRRVRSGCSICHAPASAWEPGFSRGSIIRIAARRLAISH